VKIIEQREDEAVSIVAACASLGVSRASLYRRRRSSRPAAIERVRAPSPRRLDDVERQRILDTLHLPEFVDQPPTEVYAKLLGQGTYLASIRTMYRVLAEVGETGERRNQRRPQSHAMPSLTAKAPNQVWTWDITKLATIHRGVFLMAYVIIDLFSRFVVGWMLAAKECKHLAAQLFAGICIAAENLALFGWTVDVAGRDDGRAPSGAGEGERRPAGGVGEGAQGVGRVEARVSGARQAPQFSA